MSTPIDTVNELSDAINRGDLEAALVLYEPNAVLVAQPGQLARDSTELRAALGRLIGLKPELRSETQNVIEVDDMALYTGRWTLRGTDPSGQATTMGRIVRRSAASPRRALAHRSRQSMGCEDSGATLRCRLTTRSTGRAGTRFRARPPRWRRAG
jgi:ketosteroid isomerase-like protein